MDKTRNRVVYHEEEANPLEETPEDNVLPISKKSFAIDKGKEGSAEFDFTHFYTRPKLAKCFVEAVWKLKGNRRLQTIVAYKKSMTYFWQYLDDLEQSNWPIYELKQIDLKVMKMYIKWLKDHTDWAIITQKIRYDSVKSLLTYLMEHCTEEVSPELDFPKNPFPRSNAQQRHREAYSQNVMGQMVKAIVADLEEIYQKVETPYIKAGKGVDPRGGGHSTRKSLYRDLDNMRWYFENILNCQYIGQQELRKSGHPTFETYAAKFHGGLSRVWELLGLWDDTCNQTLVPFVLSYAYMSGGNPTPIGEMRRDCIKYEPLGKRRYIEMFKARGMSVQKIKHSPKCVKIVERVLELTKDLAAEVNDVEELKDFLWLYRGHKGEIKRLPLGNAPVFAYSLSVFVKKHNIRDDDGKPLKINLARFRPTFATEAYLKTNGDMVKLQQLLGHSVIATTQTYISAAGMPEMMENAFADLSGHEQEIKAKIVVADVASELDVSKEEAAKLLSGDFDTFLSKCRNPLNSPLKGEQNGKTCTRFHGCLRCGHSLVTTDDLPKIFSYQNSLVKIGERNIMSSDLFDKTFGSDIGLIDNIASRFPNEIIEDARRKALESPCPDWDEKVIVSKHLMEIGI